MKKEIQNKENELDNLFKDKLQNRTFEYQESDWADAEKLIVEAEKSGILSYKKRRNWFWFGSFVLLLLLSISFIYFMRDNGEIKSENIITQNNASPDLITQPQNDTSKKATQTIKDLDEQSLNPEQDNLIGVKETKLQNKNDLTDLENTDDNKMTTSPKNNSTVQSAKTQKEKIDIINNSTNNTTEKNTDQILESSQNKNTLAIEKAEQENQNKSSSTNISSENNLQSSNQSDLSKVEPIIEENKKQEDKSESALTTNQEKLSCESKSTLINKQDSAIVENKPALTNPLDPEKKLNWFVGVHGGFDYVTKSLSSPSETYDASIAQRNAQENPLWTAGLGIYGGFAFKKWSLSSGLNMYKFGEVTNYPYTSYYEEYVDLISYFETNILDTVDIIYDTIFYDTTSMIDSIITYYILDSVPFLDSMVTTDIVSLDSTAILKEKNLISYVEIPLLFGYQWNSGNWNFQIETGPSIGIYTFSNGYTINADASPTSVIEQFQANTFKKYSLNWILTPTVGYALNDHFEIQCKPYLRFNLKSVSDDINIQLKYQSYGAHVGLIYRF